MLCKDAEYKNMDQDVSQGQLYDVQNEIKILCKAKVGPTHFLQQLNTKEKKIMCICASYNHSGLLLIKGRTIKISLCKTDLK